MIYASLLPDRVHVFHQRGKTHLSRCAGPGTVCSDDGSERQTSGSSTSDPVWARRLASPWANHWRCEEFATAPDRKNEIMRDTVAAMARVCRQMYAGNCLL